jgi:hypothetical protein
MMMCFYILTIIYNHCWDDETSFRTAKFALSDGLRKKNVRFLSISHHPNRHYETTHHPSGAKMQNAVAK